MKSIAKIKLYYNEFIESQFNISELSGTFPALEFQKTGSLSELHNTIQKDNGILILTYDDFKELKAFLDASLGNKLFVILYDQEEKSLQESNLPDYIYDILTGTVSRKKMAFSINKVYATLKNQLELSSLTNRFAMQSKELHTLNSIGISLSTERDIDKLLETILYKCREITESDSGSLYIVEEMADMPADPNNYFSNKKLLFKLAQNSTIDVPFKEQLLELNKKSISGYVALNGKPLLITDAYDLPVDSEYKHNKSFDESVGYRCTSMLIVPMKNQKDELIGVIQLINKKINPEVKLTSNEIVKEQVVEFDENDQELVFSLASQAAILIDNTKLYYNIKNLFEGFIKASVTAIEARDPTTSGHSERVADLTVALAEKADAADTGSLGVIKFSRSDLQQIKYASLLHDFGKIGVKEDVLIKAKKLYPYELELLQQRFRYIKKCMELNLANAKLSYLMEHDKEKALVYFEEIGRFYNEKLNELDNSLNIIIAANEPSILAQESSDKLKELNGLIFEDLDNTKIQYISQYELESLSILRGSLRENERLEIESHVTHTYEFLSKIPWTNEFKMVPDIAYSHHEKLDGTGYPRKINAASIPVPSKMMAISDIYDALTASDRPYKKALPAEKALDILGYEVKANKLDQELYNLFVEAKVYEVCKRAD
jgi:HD-GYP domain-containing protein (c-di-GMP phosphodiesterase class II)